MSMWLCHSHPSQKRSLGMVTLFFRTAILIRGIDLSQTYNKHQQTSSNWNVTPRDYFMNTVVILWKHHPVRCHSVSQQRFHFALLFRMARASGPGRSPLLPIKDSPRATGYVAPAWTILYSSRRSIENSTSEFSLLVGAQFQGVFHLENTLPKMLSSNGRAEQKNYALEECLPDSGQSTKSSAVIIVTRWSFLESRLSNLCW